jgi:hypothetical protein
MATEKCGKNGWFWVAAVSLLSVYVIALVSDPLANDKTILLLLLLFFYQMGTTIAMPRCFGFVTALVRAANLRFLEFSSSDGSSSGEFFCPVTNLSSYGLLYLQFLQQAFIAAAMVVAYVCHKYLLAVRQRRWGRRGQRGGASSDEDFEAAAAGHYQFASANSRNSKATGFLASSSTNTISSSFGTGGNSIATRISNSTPPSTDAYVDATSTSTSAITTTSSVGTTAESDVTNNGDYGDEEDDEDDENMEMKSHHYLDFLAQREVFVSCNMHERVRLIIELVTCARF